MGIMNIIEELFNDLDDQRFQQLQKLTENIILFFHFLISKKGQPQPSLQQYSYDIDDT